jgi:Na+/melibiose symporter-like transporter
MADSGNTPDEPKTRPSNWQFRFGIGGLMLVMLVACVMAAAASYSYQAIRGRASMRFVLVLFTVAGPMLLLVVVSVLLGLIKWLKRAD